MCQNKPWTDKTGQFPHCDCTLEVPCLLYANGFPVPRRDLNLGRPEHITPHATDPFLEPEPKTKQTNRKISNAHHSTKTHGATQHGTHTGRHTAVGELAEAGVGLVHVDDLRVVGEVAAVCAGDEADEGEEEERGGCRR